MDTNNSLTPPTFPAYPTNGGPLHVARPKLGTWYAEPKYNGWRALVHAPSGAMWNREGKRLSIAHEFQKALAQIRALPFAWLDCEALERRHGIGRGSLIVLDLVLPELIYTQRRALLTKQFPLCPEPEHVQENAIYVTPSHCDAAGLWSDLQLVTGHSSLVTFFEGLVMKKADSLYPMQLRSPKEPCRAWVKHRWQF